jgi:hypothetical protein
MGAATSCRCNNPTEITSMNLEKEKKETVKDDKESNNYFEIITTSKANHRINSKVIIVDECDNKNFDEEFEDNQANDERQKFNAHIKSDVENISSLSHKKKDSSEIKMEIYDDNLNDQNKSNYNFVMNRSKDKNGRNYSYITHYQNMINRAVPLEIINEINADVSKDSVVEGISLKKVSKMSGSNEQNEKTDNIQEQQNKNYMDIVNLSTIPNSSDNKNYSNTNSINAVLKENSTNCGENIKKISGMGAKLFTNNPLFRNTKKLNQIITSIIPEHKLLNSKNSKIFEFNQY